MLYMIGRLQRQFSKHSYDELYVNRFKNMLLTLPQKQKYLLPAVDA